MTGNSEVALCSFAAQPELQQLEGFLCVCSLKAVGLRNEGSINQRKERSLRVGDLVTPDFCKSHSAQKKQPRIWQRMFFFFKDVQDVTFTVKVPTHFIQYKGKRWQMPQIVNIYD